jgi:hypothetical protein
VASPVNRAPVPNCIRIRIQLIGSKASRLARTFLGGLSEEACHCKHVGCSLWILRRRSAAATGCATNPASNARPQLRDVLILIGSGTAIGTAVFRRHYFVGHGTEPHPGSYQHGEQHVGDQHAVSNHGCIRAAWIWAHSAGAGGRPFLCRSERATAAHRLSAHHNRLNDNHEYLERHQFSRDQHHQHA